MAELAKKGLLYLMSEKCYDNYLVDFNFFDGSVKVLSGVAEKTANNVFLCF